MSHRAEYTHPPHEQPEPWFRHVVEEEGLPQSEHGSHTRPVALAMAFILTIVFVGGTILASYLYFNVYMTGKRREKIESTVLAEEFFNPTTGTRAKAQAALNDYYFASDDLARKGVVAVPIDEGKKRVLAKYAGGKVPK